MKTAKAFDWKEWHQQPRIIRRSLRKLVPGKISVRKGRGTACAWITITGPGEFGNFEPDQIAVLVELGLLHSCTVNTNYAQIAPDSRKFWAEKLSRLACLELFRQSLEGIKSRQPSAPPVA